MNGVHDMSGMDGFGPVERKVAVGRPHRREIDMNGVHDMAGWTDSAPSSAKSPSCRRRPWKVRMNGVHDMSGMDDSARRAQSRRRAAADRGEAGMNGVHDMGGMDGFGPVEPEPDEPVFHHPWEGRVFAIRAALRPKDRVPGWGSFRYDLERIPPADYLRMSYYERWFAISMDRSSAAPGDEASSRRDGRAPTGGDSPPRPVARRSGPGRLDADVPPRFRPVEDVRARNLHPPGHTRLPRYTRGKTGVVKRDNGVYALQDTDEAGQAIDRPPQHVYTVRFTARDLWGERASARDTVYVDLWEDHLEPA